MLEPNDRHLLLDSLRPPVGYELDCAIGTTFSLDLLTLLTTPIAFTLFDWEDSEGRPTVEPMALLQAVRRHAEHLRIFCQAGQISVPKGDQLFYGYLEKSVFEVMPLKDKGVFHPKVWVLRYTALAGSVLYRVLCLSRNLTFDRSWDTMLVLEGELIDRRNAFASNHPLGDFIATLPTLTLRQLPHEVKADVDQVASELRRVRFDLPRGFDELRFHPLGIRGVPRWPFTLPIDRLLVISPFLSDGCLSRLTGLGKKNVLISRLESLAPLQKACASRFAEIYTLSSEANEEKNDEEEPSASEATLTGLHAKLFITEQGNDASTWTGSANATDAAFSGNVEFLVELRGKKSSCGIATIMSTTPGRTSFADLLQKFTLSDPEPADALQQNLDRLVDLTRRSMARAGFVASVASTGDDFRLQLHHPASSGITVPTNIKIRCWPITLHEDASAMAVPVPGTTIDLGRISFEAITSFFVFHVAASIGDRHADARFVLNLPLNGAPEERHEMILRSLLKDRKQVLRFLLLLLANEGLEVHRALRSNSTNGQVSVNGGASVQGLPLFEMLVRALDKQSTKIDEIARIVEDLCKTTAGRQLLPDDFDEIWQPIWAARKRQLD